MRGYHLPPPPPGPPPLLLLEYEDRVTDEPLLTVGLILPMPLKMLVPPLTVTPYLSVGCDDPLTTIPLPPLDGVLKAIVSLPTVMEYHVFLLHDEA